MSSNSQTMTVEERLVQKLKGEALLTLVEDEDALTELARRAVNLALFEKRWTPGDTWNRKELPSPAVAAAQAVAEKAAEAVVQAEIDRLKEDPKFQKSVREALALAMPTVIDRIAMQGIGRLINDAQMQAMIDVQQMIREGRP
jgi:hypothetical protein